MPYVVLEAGGARVPMVATDVGGIPEIFGPFADRLGPSDNPEDLARRIVEMLDLPPEMRQRRAADFALHVAANFNIQSMVNAVMGGYQEALSTRRARPAPVVSTVNSST
jgi:glycosyltransferase involved in cell wall biosynthesis